MSGMNLETNSDTFARLLLLTLVFFSIGAFFLIAGFNGQLVVRSRIMQLWIGVSSSVLGMFFLTRFLSGLSTFMMLQNVRKEESIMQSFVRDMDLV